MNRIAFSQSAFITRREDFWALVLYPKPDYLKTPVYSRPNGMGTLQRLERVNTKAATPDQNLHLPER